jgi:cell pole-organizing protein PopZ
MSMLDKNSPPEPSMDQILATIRRILAEDDGAVMVPPPRNRANSDVLDLTEAIGDDGTVRHITPITLVTPEAAAPALPDGRIEPVPPRSAGAEMEPRLVSDAASDAVAASFARLASMPSREDGGHALDDLVRETLRPLLQDWLDEHLPELVERLVRAEIARVVGARPLAP